MAEENQAQQEPQRVTKEPQQVTTKDPKKLEAGKRLAAINCKKREAKKREGQAQLERTTSGVNQYYGIGAVIALGVMVALVIAFIGPRKAPQSEKSRMFQCHIILLSNPLRLTSLRWINLFYTIKMDKKSIVNDLYHAAVISVLAVGYSMPGKKILKIAPPSIQRFNLEDTGKLVAIVAASEMTREYLIKQKILPDRP